MISCVRASREPLRTVVLMPWGARGSGLSWADRPVGVPSCPAPPCPAAVRRPEPSRPWYVRVLDPTNRFTWESVYSFFRRIAQDSCPRCPGGEVGRLSPGRTDPSASCTATPRPVPPPCAAPPRPAHGMSGFWARQVGLLRQLRNSFVRASEESLRTVVYDALEALGGKRDGCRLGEPTRRRPVLPGPAPPRRPAVRCPAPTRLWYVRVLDSTGSFNHWFK